jgi:hypothetical protein
MLDFNTSPENRASNFLFGDMTIGDKFKTNLIKDVKTQQAEGGWTLEGVGLTKLEDGTEVFKTPQGYNDNPEFWKWAQNNPEFTKELYKKAIVPLRDGQPGPIPFNVTTPEGRMVQGTYDSNGVVKLNDYSPDQVRQMQNDQKAKESEIVTSNAVSLLKDSVTSGISALELASGANTKAVNDVVNAVTDYGKKARPVLDDQAKTLQAVADNIITAGNVRAGIAEDHRKAMAQPEIMAKANSILNASLDFVAKSNADRDKAKAQLDDVMSNPFFRGASVVYGGDDKNPIISSAKKTFDTAQDAAQKSQQIANSVMTGIDQYQKILEKQYLVKTPEEVRADAAKLASDVKKEAAKATLESIGTNVSEANAAAKATDTIFGDKYKILHEKISGLAALVQAATGSEKLVLQTQLMELRRELAAQAEDGKFARAEMRAAGLDTPEGAILSKEWAAINKVDSQNPKLVASLAVAGKTRNDPNFKALQDFRNPRLPAGARLEAAYGLFRNGMDVSKIAPGIELTVDPSQNGWDKAQQVVGITAQAAEALRAAKGDKYNPNTDNTQVLEATQKAIVQSIKYPEEPLSISVEGKKLTIPAASPGKVFPGSYIPLVGTATDDAENSPLPKEMFSRLRESKLAQAMARADMDYQKMPVSSSGEKATVGYKDAFVIGRKIRESDPTYTLDKFATELRDIYQAGIYLNNKYLNPTLIGLPEQTDYRVKIEKQSVGKTIMGTIGAFAGSGSDSKDRSVRETLARTNELVANPGGILLGTTTSIANKLLGSTGAARKSATELSFRLGEQNAFSALRQIEEIDLTNVTKTKLYQTQLDGKFWADRKVAE